MTNPDAAGLFFQLLLLLVFCASLASKVRDFGAFRQAIADSGHLPGGWSVATARLAAVAEGAIVLLLAVGLVPSATGLARAGFVLGIAVLAAYTVWLTSVRLRRPEVTCHCFGKSGATVSWLDVVRNCLLIAGASVGYTQAAGSVRPAAEELLIALLAGAGALLMIGFVDLTSTLSRSGSWE